MNKSRLHQGDINRLREFGIKTLGRRGTLSAEEEQSIRAALSEMETVRSNGEIQGEGEALRHARILLDGWAVRQRVLSDGRRQIFSFLVPGDVFGICARPNGESSCATVALVPATVADLPFLDEGTRAGSHIASTIAEDVLAMEESLLTSQVVRLGRQSAYERVIGLLLEFHDRLAAVGLVNDNSFNLPFTQEVLADALGLSTVHTNRTLQQLRRERLIETHMTHMRLNNIPLLAELSDYRRPSCVPQA